MNPCDPSLNVKGTVFVSVDDISSEQDGTLSPLNDDDLDEAGTLPAVYRQETQPLTSQPLSDGRRPSAFASVPSPAKKPEQIEMATMGQVIGKPPRGMKETVLTTKSPSISSELSEHESDTRQSTPEPELYQPPTGQQRQRERQQELLKQQEEEKRLRQQRQILEEYQRKQQHAQKEQQQKEQQELQRRMEQQKQEQERLEEERQQQKQLQQTILLEQQQLALQQQQLALQKQQQQRQLAQQQQQQQQQLALAQQQQETQLKQQQADVSQQSERQQMYDSDESTLVSDSEQETGGEVEKIPSEQRIAVSHSFSCRNSFISSTGN